MHLPPINAPILALLGFGSSKLWLVSGLILILCLRKKFPKFLDDIKRGMRAFRDASDEMAHEAGRSVGGIHGKPAAEALTIDNQMAELYDPMAFQRRKGPIGIFKRAVNLVRSLFRQLIDMFRRLRSGENENIEQ